VTWRELTGVVLFVAGLLGKVLGLAAGGSFHVAADVLFAVGLLFILWDRMRRGLGRPSLAKWKEQVFKDPPIPAPTDWMCPECHERNPVSFEVCWKCGHAGSGSATSNNASSGRDT